MDHHHPTDFDPNPVPLDPDLFNPEVVGSNSFQPINNTNQLSSLLPGPDESFYPAEDDEGWDLDQDQAYYETDEDEQADLLAKTGGSPAGLNTTRNKHQLSEDSEQGSEGSFEEAEGDDDDDDGESGSETESEAEGEDSNDLRRLIGAIHAKGSSTNDDEARGILGKEWDRSMDQELNEIQEAERQMRPGRRKKYKLRGEPELSVEVSILLGKANICFIEKKYDEAIPLFEEAVRIEPMCKMAWNNLGAIYQDLGDFEKSCQFRMIGAHLTSKSAEIWKELGSESRQHGLLSQAIYCYSEAIKAGKDDVEAMWDRSYLLYEIGRPRQALIGYLAILKLNPHNPDVLREVAHLCATTNEREQPIKLFQDALCHYQSVLPNPTEQWLREGFGLEHVRTLIKLLMETPTPTERDTDGTLEDQERVHNRYYSTLKLIKQSVRWLQARWDRHAEGYIDWDTFEDDREFDLGRMSRQGWEEQANPAYEHCPLYPLETDLRAYLGICRLKIADDEEAALHFDIIKRLDVETHSELFTAIGDAYYKASQWNQALEFYQDLAENDATNQPVVWHKIGQSYRKLGNLEGAIECFEAVIETDPFDLVAKTQLAELFELIGDRQKAFDVVNDLIEIRRTARETGTVIEKDPALLNSNNTSNKTNNTLASRSTTGFRSKAERQLEEELLTYQYSTTYERLETLSEQLATAQDDQEIEVMTEYVRLASPLVEGFRNTPALFPSMLARKFSGLNNTLNRVGKSSDNDRRTTLNPDEADPSSSQVFRGIRFPQWVRVFVYHAFCCCKIRRSAEASELLYQVTRAPVFRQSASMQQVLRLAYVAVCYHRQEFVMAINAIRWLSSRLVYHSDPILLISALLSRGFPESIAFFNSNTSKWLLRQLKMLHRTIGQFPISDQNPDETLQRRFNQDENGKNGVDQSDEDEDEDDSYWKVTKFDPHLSHPVFAVTFAQIMAGTRSYKPAIIYYLRMFELYPNEPLINLLLSISYCQRAMQRQTDNRHHQIIQAFSFWDHYKKNRSKEFDQEVEYNLGRLYHGLGLTSLAIVHYNQVLNLCSSSSSPDRQTNENHTENLELKELSVYNLILIYNTIGDFKVCNQLIKKYLSV